MAENTFNLRNRIKTSNAVSNIDYWYGPYQNIEEACNIIPKVRRNKGLTVGILDDTFGIKEYWWAKGIEDNNLVLKENKFIPTLEYTKEFPENTKINIQKNEVKLITFIFKTSTPGTCVYQIYKNGNIYKTLTGPSNEFSFEVDSSTEGRFIYQVKAVDPTQVSSSNTLEYTVVVGGITINDNFKEQVIENINNPLNTTTDISFSVDAKIADETRKISLQYQVLDDNGNIFQNIDYTKPSNNNQLKSDISLGKISQKGKYTLKLKAFDTDSSEEYVEKTYSFIILNPDEFYVDIQEYTKEMDTRSIFTMSYRIVSGINAFYKILFKRTLAGGTSETITIPDIQGNVSHNYSIGFKKDGNYSISVIAEVGNKQSEEKEFSIQVNPYTANFNRVEEGLISEFKAQGKSNSNTIDTQGYWYSELNDNYRFELHNLNYNTNGWLNIDNTDETYLKFTGDSYGILKKNSGTGWVDYSPMSVLEEYNNQGFSCEMVFKTTNIGVQDAKVLTLYRDKKESQAGLSVSFNKIKVSSNTDSRYTDITDNKWIHVTIVINKTTNTNPELIEDYAKWHLVSIYINGSQCSAGSLKENEKFTDSVMTVLNCIQNEGSVSDFGNCDIKCLRFYDRPLMSSEVVNNYLSTIHDTEKQLEISGRNQNVLPIVHFIRMTQDDASYTQNNPKEHTFTTFSDLNTMTVKSEQKIKYVRGKMVYETPDSDSVEYPYVVVQTQGTSSLAYPVKNYKVIIYKNPDESEGKVFENKKKIKIKDNWEAENSYTLKCDYMDASHLNNTPTASYYEHIVDTLNTDGYIPDDKLSPAKKAAKDSQVTENPKYYYDAIKGFPCIVYYYETLEEYNKRQGTYVGSYMFNLDKSANSLGFEVSQECQSFEGTSNTDGQSAGTFCSYESWKDWKYQDYVNNAYSKYIAEKGDNITLEEFVLQYTSSGIKYSEIGYSDSNLKDSGYLLDKETALNGTEENPNNRLDQYQSEYKYVAQDFEARYDYEDRESGEEEFWGNSNYNDPDSKGLLRMINWVSDMSSSAGTEDDQFKKDFDNYFNLPYCALYLMQTIFMGQIDNLGKNAMWDTWDGQIWYPRPYDMDSMAGLTNVGEDKINPDAEIGIEFSPTKQFGGTAREDVGIARDETDGIPMRYKSYNTRQSRFWTSFLKSFRGELEYLYNKLRTLGLYNIDNIMTFYKSMTTDIIGETYYNKDMAIKFIEKPTDATYLTRLHGNRLLKFESWMRDRLIFCDTYFKYLGEDTLNTSVTFRSYKVSNNHTFAIKTYSPQYIRFAVGSGKDADITVFCSPQSKYINPNTGIEEEGVLFQFPIKGGDKEVFIEGAGNIKEFPNLSSLGPSSLDLKGAKKLTKLKINNSSGLTGVTLESNTFLQELDFEGCQNLGTASGQNSLDVSKCPYLKTVNISNTKITSVNLPEGGALRSFKAVNSGLKQFQGNSLQLLEDLDISNNMEINNFSIEKCPQIVELNLDNLPLKTVKVQDCLNVNTINLQYTNNITSLDIKLCPNLKKLNLQGSQSLGIKDINLQTLKGITDLDIRNSSVECLKFPVSPDTYDLTNLYTTGSNIKKVVGVTDVSTEDYIDFTYLNSINNISFYNCRQVTKIINFNTVVNGNFFENASALQSIEGTTLKGINSCSNLFRTCTNLEKIQFKNYDFTECTRLSYSFYETPKLPYSYIKSILQNCNSTCDLSSMCYSKGVSDESNTSLNTLPSKFFGKCNKSNSLALIFYNSGLKNYNNDSFQSTEGDGTLYTTNLQSMCRSTELEKCDYILNKFPEVTNAAGAFAYSNLKSIPKNLLYNNTKLQNVKGMFLGCTALSTDISEYGEFFKNNSQISNADIFFRGCSIKGTVPTGFFSYLKPSSGTVNIEGFFANTQLDGINSSLFIKNSGEEYTPTLKIGGLFSKAIKAKNENLLNLPSEVFNGANNIISAGRMNSLGLNGEILDPNIGVFEDCTNIQSIGTNIFDSFQNTTTMEGFFKGCTNLSQVIDYGGTRPSFSDMIQKLKKCANYSYMFYDCNNFNFNNNSDIISIFAEENKSNVIYTNHMFYNNQNIQSFSPTLLQNCNNLQDASYMFYGCSNLTQKNQGDKEYLKGIFKGCTSLKSVKGMFANTKLNYYDESSEQEYIIDIHSNLFEDCKNTLEDTSSMFENCEYLRGEIKDVDDHGLFQDCLKLKTTSKMFYNCKLLNGYIPKTLFKISEDVENIQFYQNLIDISQMFYNCHFNKLHTDRQGEDLHYYLIHPETFEKLLYVENISGLLSRDSVYRENDFTDSDGNSVYNYELHSDTFNTMFKLKNISKLFNYCKKLSGHISNVFSNSVGSITDASQALCHTDINSISSDFLLNNSGINTVLFKVYAMLYNCSKITSEIPEVWNRTKFQRISVDQDNYKGYCYNINVNNNSFDNLSETIKNIYKQYLNI